MVRFSRTKMKHKIVICLYGVSRTQSTNQQGATQKSGIGTV